MTRTAAAFVAIIGLCTTASAGFAQPGPEPLCRPSEDPEYAKAVNVPVQVGGGPVYGAARQKRYLSALRGPKGEEVTFVRKGAVGDPNVALIDRYEVSYEGLAKPMELYLDFYHFAETLVPGGLTCGASLDLGLPPPDPFMSTEQMQAAAVESAGGEAEPAVELGSGSPAVLVVDGFRKLRDTARALAISGKKPNPGEAMAAALSPQTIVVAYPRTCGDQRVLPATLGLSDSHGGSAVPDSSTSDADAIRTLVAGTPVADGSLAGVFRMAALPPGVMINVGYKGSGCPDDAMRATFTIETTAARLLESPMPSRAPGDAAIGRWVAIQAIVDHQGRFRAARALGGGLDLTAAALDALAAWKAEPARVNGVAVPVPVVVRVAFEQTNTPR